MCSPDLVNVQGGIMDTWAGVPPLMCTFTEEMIRDGT